MNHGLVCVALMAYTQRERGVKVGVVPPTRHTELTSQGQRSVTQSS